MKNYLLFLFIIFLFISCDTNTNPNNIPNDINEPKDIPSKNPTAFLALLNQFSTLDLPLEINQDFHENFEGGFNISTDDAIAFFDTDWIEQGEMPNKSISGVGYYKINDYYSAYITREMDLPVGSGDHIRYIMRIISNRDNEIMSNHQIAAFMGWDGGYLKEECIIENQEKIKTSLYNEDENLLTGYKKVKESKFEMTINSDGTVESNEEIIKNKKEKLEQEDFKTNVVNWSGIPDAIKKDLSGKLQYAINWDDKLGINFLLFTTKNMASKAGEDALDYNLFAYHYIYNNKNDFKRLWKTQDFDKECMFDSQLRLLEESVKISDLDGDKIAETTYIYTLGCISDLSPYDMKLIMHEGKEKMAIRGQVRLSIDGYLEDNAKINYTIDSESFKEQPSQFQQFAEDYWLLFDEQGF